MVITCFVKNKITLTMSLSVLRTERGGALQVSSSSSLNFNSRDNLGV